MEPEHSSASAQSPPTAGVSQPLGGRYRLEGLVGRGGMASVWRATDVVLDRPVAVKRLHARWQDDPELAERFRREAQVVARLSHPNLVQLLDRGEEVEGPYLVFELVEGQDLKSILRDRGRFPPGEAARICGEVARALAYAHDRGVVHRDIKAHNVLLADDGRTRLTDFGIARVVAAAEEGITRTGSMLGTADYLAPEQAEGRSVDGRADVYALGVVLYELLTGQLPYTGEGFLAVALQHLNKPMPDPRTLVPDVPEALAQAVLRACEKEPDDRFPNASVMADVLEGREPRAPLVAGAPAATVVTPEPDTGDVTGEQPRESTRVMPTPVAPATEPVVSPRMPPPPPPPGPPAPAPRVRPKRKRRGVLLAWLAGLLAIFGAAALLVGFGVIDLGGDGAGGSTSPGGDLVALPLEAVDDHDPQGDNSEGSSLVPLVYDGDPATEWHTEGYSTEDFSGLDKDGVGLVFKLQQAAEPSELVLWSSTPGGQVSVLGPPETGGVRPVLAEPRPITGGEQAIALDLDEPTQVFLLYITSLPQDPALAGESRPFRAAVGQVELRGPANP